MTDTTMDQPHRRRARDPETVRARIIEIAVREFAENGFEGARLPKIAEDAGVGTSLIIHHFKSKRLLWEAVFEHLSRDARASLEGMVADETRTAAERLRNAIAYHAEFYARSPAISQLLANEAHHFSDRLEWICDRFARNAFDVMIKLITAAQAEGAARMLSPERLRYAIIGVASIAAVSAEFEYLTGRDPRSPKEVKETIDFLNKLIFIDG